MIYWTDRTSQAVAGEVWFSNIMCLVLRFGNILLGIIFPRQIARCREKISFIVYSTSPSFALSSIHDGFKWTDRLRGNCRKIFEKNNQLLSIYVINWTIPNVCACPVFKPGVREHFVQFLCMSLIFRFFANDSSNLQHGSRDDLDKTETVSGRELLYWYHKVCNVRASYP